MRVKLLLLSVVLFIWRTTYSQCGPNTPTFNINLTGKPDSVWKSPSISRNDNCCGTSAPNKCIKFIITLDPKAQGISFDIPEGVGCGAKPGGALFFQIGCGPPQPIGAPICLVGVGPHVLTFCKPGNNPNCYEIRSVPPVTAGTDVTINDGCTSQLHATGYIASTVTWHSIFPGASGAYNNFLSCVSGCLDPIVKATGAYPPYVDYVVCGKSEAICNPQIICDTVRVTFNPTLGATILPAIPTICFGATSITLTANGSGGTPPYSYLWNNINSSQSINVGAGTYNVVVSDGSGCPPAFASVTVTSFSVTITANAGVDDTVCIQNPIAVLNGSVTGASGGIWSGNGAFSPTNTTLSGVTYTPTAAELAAGFADIKLITTGNGTCPPDTDVVRIYYLGFTGTVSITSTPVSCFGGNNGSATVSIVGG
ncbi:MAG TPA: hypothetical protein VFL70_05250, partial [Bacteroidia bacterium]|nr:hypothetical protein [Bacteroidia bacterium]